MRSRAPDAEVCWRSGSRGSRPGLSRAAAPAVPGGASPTGNTEYLSLVLVAVRAVCRGWAGCTHSGALPGGWGAPVRCRSEIKPCTCLTYPGVSWRLVNTTRCVRTRSCGRAALAPFSGTCESSVLCSEILHGRNNNCSSGICRVSLMAEQESWCFQWADLCFSG
ncbi:uncharacterized protein FYW23_000988 isoform 6-T7 [Sylvia borin]